jgi:hypothetical protein
MSKIENSDCESSHRIPRKFQFLNHGSLEFMQAEKLNRDRKELVFTSESFSLLLKFAVEQSILWDSLRTTHS